MNLKFIILAFYHFLDTSRKYFSNYSKPLALKIHYLSLMKILNCEMLINIFIGSGIYQNISFEYASGEKRSMLEFKVVDQI